MIPEEDMFLNVYGTESYIPNTHYGWVTVRLGRMKLGVVLGYISFSVNNGQVKKFEKELKIIIKNFEFTEESIRVFNYSICWLNDDVLLDMFEKGTGI